MPHNHCLALTETQKGLPGKPLQLSCTRLTGPQRKAAAGRAAGHVAAAGTEPARQQFQSSHSSRCHHEKALTEHLATRACRSSTCRSSTHPCQPPARGRLPIGRAAGHAAAGTPQHRAAQGLLLHRGRRATGGRPGGRTALLIEQSIGGRLQLPVVRLQSSLQGRTERWVGVRCGCSPES